MRAVFFGGMKYQQSKTLSRQFSRQGNGQFGQSQANGQGNGTRTNQQNRQGFAPVMGQITKVDNNSITVSQQDGSSRIVMLSDSTTISKTAEGTTQDLTVGSTIAAFGQDNNGVVTAQSIQLNPSFQFGQRGNNQNPPTQGQ